MRPIVNMLEEDRATDIGNNVQIFGKDRTCAAEISSGETDRHRQTYSSQYFATAPVGEVTNRPIAILRRVSTNVPRLACYNLDAHEWIMIFFGRKVTDKIGKQKSLYYATSSNLCFCTTWQNAETRNHIFHLIVLCYTQCTCALSS